MERIYKTVIQPLVMNGSETWFLNKKNIKVGEIRIIQNEDEI